MTAAALEAPLPPFERVLQAVVTGALFALGFFLPFSTAGVSVSLAVLLAVVILLPQRVWRLRPWREPVFAIGLVLLAWIALRALLDTGWQRATASAVNQYHELLMVPLLWALLRGSARPGALLAGLAAGSLLFALLHWLPLPGDWPTKLALRRISAGFGLSVVAFLLFEFARSGRLPRAAGYAAAAFLAATVVFAVGARTGHLTLLLLALCAAWRAAPARWRLPAALGIVALAVALATLLSTSREKRGDIAMSNKVRAELLLHSVEVARQHWMWGAGFGGFAAAYERVAAQRGTPPGAHWARSANPHNEYLLQAVAGGLPALALFTAWLATPLARGWRRRREADPDAGLLACVVLAFALACVFNSLLLDFVEGHLYGALLAWLMARRPEGA